MLKRHYSRFLGADPERLHFAAHSHHPWPDVTRDAQLRCWDDAARDMDSKWERIFGEVVPKAQRHVARLLELAQPGRITFAPNTHELVMRLFSALGEGPLRVLTTDSEFHSVSRQLARLEELPRIRVDRVSTRPFDSFEERFADAARGARYDLIYLSHVFYNSGRVVANLGESLSAVGDEATILVDGYHAFCALPVSLQAFEGRIFYLAGGYKYAQCGEGACFMYAPPGNALRPVDTGWLASFGELERSAAGAVAFSDDAFRFWGATFDPSGLYRFNAVMDWLESEAVTIAAIHTHARSLQERFLAALEGSGARLSVDALLTPRSLDSQGNFLAFELADAPQLARTLSERNVSVDVRGDRIRFGFGPYQDADDVDRLIERLG